MFNDCMRIIVEYVGKQLILNCTKKILLLFKSRDISEFKYLFARKNIIFAKYSMPFVSLFLCLSSLSIAYISSAGVISVSAIITVLIYSLFISLVICSVTVLVCGVLRELLASIIVEYDVIYRVIVTILIILSIVICLYEFVSRNVENPLEPTLFLSGFVIVYSVAVFIAVHNKFNLAVFFVLIVYLVGNFVLFKNNIEDIGDSFLHDFGIGYYQTRIVYLQNHDTRDVSGIFKFSDIKYTYVQYQECGNDLVFVIKNDDILNKIVFR